MGVKQILGSKFCWGQKKLRVKNFGVSKFLGSTNFGGQKMFRVEILFGANILETQNLWVSNKFLGSNFVGCNNLFGGSNLKEKLFRLNSFETIKLGTLFSLTRLRQKSFHNKSAQDQPELAVSS